MKRLFPTFPDGRTGAGLLLLRLALGAAAIFEGVSRYGFLSLVGVSMGAGGALLVLGLFTPVAAAALAFSALYAALYPAGGKALWIIIFILIGAALILLGPGAYAADARIFGRRRIIIPPMPRKPPVA